MSIRKHVALVSAFSVAAVASFVIAAPREARSNIRTLHAHGCNFHTWSLGQSQYTNYSYYCAINAGSDFLTANLAGAFVDTTTGDGVAPGSNSIEIRKTPYTGASVYIDSENLPNGQGMADYYVGASNVKQNPSVYDYVEVWANLQGLVTAPFLLGVAAETN
jgi:hypothetical protein